MNGTIEIQERIDSAARELARSSAMSFDQAREAFERLAEAAQRPIDLEQSKGADYPSPTANRAQRRAYARAQRRAAA